jgi:hypothetical protein
MCRLLVVIEIERATKRVSGTEIGCGKFLLAMAQLAPPQPAESISMELDVSAIDAAALPPVTAAAAAAAAALQQISAVVSAASGQLRVCIKALLLSTTASTHTMGCSCVLCMLLWRELSGVWWGTATPCLQWRAAV